MQSVEEIYRKYAKTVYKYLMSLTHDVQIAEEITQETFYHAIKGIDHYDGSCRVTTWLCAIAKNQLYAYQRKHPMTEQWDFPDKEDANASVENGCKTSESAEDTTMKKQEYLQLMKQIHRMKEPYREVLYLRLFGDLSFKEIGEVLGKTENWARVSFYRGKEQLRKELRNHEI